MTKKTMTWLIGALLCASLTLVGACSKDKKDDGDQGKTPTTEPAPDGDKPPALTPPEIADEDLPVETDFEEEAESQITADNFMKELEALESEITAEE